MKIQRRKSALVGLICAALLGTGAEAIAARFNSDPGESRLIIRRLPTIGNNVALQVTIDGRKAGSLIYGHTFEVPISSGQHRLTVRATPRRTFFERWATNLDVRPGETCAFTAYDEGTRVALRRD
jgi:hypothetical protein